MDSSPPSAVIDFHVHPLVDEVSETSIIKEMKAANVEHAVLLAMDLDLSILTQKNFHKSLEKELEYTHVIETEKIVLGMKLILQKGHTPNDQVATIVRNNPDEFTGFGSINLGYKSKRYIKSKLKEILRFKEEAGFRGIKLLPTLQFFNPSTNKNVVEVFKFALKHDLMIMYHTGCDPGPWEIPFLSKAGNPIFVEPLIKKFPQIPVILSHIGSYSSQHPGLWFNEALKIIKSYPNTYGDISAVPFLLLKEKFTSALRNAGVIKKILFGSDFPVTSAGVHFGIQATINLVNSSTILNQEEKEEIFYLNAKKLLFE